MFSTDWAKVSSFLDNLTKDAKEAFVKVAPSAMNPTKRFVNAIASACALVTVADKKVEATEINDMMSFIHEIQQIQENDLHNFATAAYKNATVELEATLANDANFTFKKQELLDSIRAVKEDESHVQMIEALLNVLFTQYSKTSPEEIAMMAEIKKVIK